MVRIIQSCKADTVWFREAAPAAFEPDANGEEMNLLMIYRDIRRQAVTGFGGALTQASAYTYSRMPEATRQAFLRACFSENGLHYSIGRTHIGSCDFSFGNFSYCDRAGDTALQSFSIACDEDYLLPFIQDVDAFRGAPLPLLASPWSPPGWMKSNGEMLHGGYLLPEYYGVWAEYVVKYILAYRERGVDIRKISVQNEPKAVQRWESCVYTSEQEQTLVRDWLAPALKKAGLSDIGIVVWDHNKERVFTRSREIFADRAARDAVAGVGFHWYSGDHFENVALCREFFPDKELLFTEGCVELTTQNTAMAQKAQEAAGGEVEAARSPWEFGECYGHDMIGNFNAGMNAFLDWNVLLDETGGPNHVSNFCGAPLIYDTGRDRLLPQPSWCFIGHFSRFVPQGSVRVAHSCYSSRLETVCFVTPAGECVAVVMNPQEQEIPFVLKDTVSGGIARLTSPAKSVTTLRYTV